MNKVCCTNCKEDIEVSIEDRLVLSDIHKEYFKCDKCKKEYTVIVYDTRSKALRSKLRQDLTKLRRNYNNKNLQRYNKSKKEFEEATERVEERLNKLTKDIDKYERRTHKTN